MPSALAIIELRLSLIWKRGGSIKRKSRSQTLPAQVGQGVEEWASWERGGGGGYGLFPRDLKQHTQQRLKIVGIEGTDHCPKWTYKLTFYQ